jgi:hypothetical protein
VSGIVCDVVEVEAGSDDAQPLVGGGGGSVDSVRELPFSVHGESPDKLPAEGPYIWYEAEFNDYVIHASGKWYRAYCSEPR